MELTKEETLSVFDKKKIKVGDILKCKPFSSNERLTVLVTEVNKFDLRVLSLTHAIKLDRITHFTLKSSDVDEIRLEMAWSCD